MEGRAGVFFVGEHTWQYEQNFIHIAGGGLRQCKMGNGYRVKSAGKDAQTGGVGRVASEELHCSLGVRMTGDPACPLTRRARDYSRALDLSIT